MPLKIRIHLNGPPPENFFQHSAGLQAIFYGWLSFGDETVAKRVHDANQSKPFSISPLYISPNKQNECYFDIALLTDWLMAPTLDGLTDASDNVRLGSERYRILGYDEMFRSEWNALLDIRDARVDYPFKILTPVAHHESGILRKSIVTPSPERYFGSWLNRWNACCPNAIPEDLMGVFTEAMAISDFYGGTVSAHLEKGRTFIGFTGDVRFRIIAPQSLSADAFRYLQALSRFANYCGTGVGATRGMGQTEYLGDSG